MKIRHKIAGDPPISFEELPDPPLFRERYSKASATVTSVTVGDTAATVRFRTVEAQRGNGASIPPADAITPAVSPVPVPSHSPARKATKMANPPEVVDEKTLRYARAYREKLEHYAKKRMEERAAGISWMHDDNPDATRRNAIQIRAAGDKLVVEAIEAEDATRDARHALSKKALQRALRMNISYEDALADITGEDIRSRPMIGSTAGLDPWSPAAPKTEIPRGTVGGRFG